MTQKTIEQKYRKLEELQKVLLRPGRYIGSIQDKTAHQWVLQANEMSSKEITWSPGLLKLFDEIITNSVDFSKTPEGKHLTTIKVTIDKDTGVISVFDNGGIPVQVHAEHNEYVPTLIFGYLHSGSNFDDTEDTDGAGQNGEGSTLTNIFSERFTVETCDGKKQLTQTWSNNMTSRTEPLIIDMPQAGFTKITYLPDYAKLQTTMTDDNYDKLVKRVYDIAGCNPKLNVYLNGTKIKLDSFKDYIKLYTSEFIFDDNGDWQVGVGRSDDGFKQISFVNSTETYVGGNHVDYVADQLADHVRAFCLKKHKIDVKPSEIKQHFRLFINSRIIKPRYNSQTKEHLITDVKDFKTSWTPSDKLITSLLKSSVIESIVSWVEAKASQKEIEEERRKNKELTKLNPKRIEKLDDANWAGKDPLKCMLFICEGDSAAKPITANRNPNTQGTLALRGKPQNANSVPLKKLLGLDKEKKEMSKDPKKKDKEKDKQTEFSNILIATGLQIGVKVEKLEQLRYGAIVITSDADQDGAHIAGLMVSNIYKFWPELFELGAVYRFFTPVVKVWQKGKKDPIAFETEREYHDWLIQPGNEATVKNFKYYKGLGTSSHEDFQGYLKNIDKHMVQLTMADMKDADIINLVFGKEDDSSDQRKIWLDLLEVPPATGGDDE